MAVLYGKAFSRRELQQRVGDLSQLADVREGMLTGGRADGMRVIDIKTGSGLEFTVFPSRAMDIGWASYQGKALSHLSKSGPVKPEFYEKDGRSFLRSFACGLVTTCGMTQMGTPCEDGGEQLGLHGRLSNIPASDVWADRRWEGDDYLLEAGGKVNESRIFGENLRFERRIKTRLGAKSLSIHDTVENWGFEETPLMLLYHINFGFPVVSGDSRLYLSADTKITPRDGAAGAGLSEFSRCREPAHGFAEQVFFHELPRDSRTFCACLFNEALQFGAYIKFPPSQLPALCQWKMMGEGDYVTGLEPCTCDPIGRARARERGVLQTLAPGQAREFHLEIGVVESPEEVEAALAVEHSGPNEQEQENGGNS